MNSIKIMFSYVFSWYPNDFQYMLAFTLKFQPKLVIISISFCRYGMATSDIYIREYLSCVTALLGRWANIENYFGKQIHPFGIFFGRIFIISTKIECEMRNFELWIGLFFEIHPRYVTKMSTRVYLSCELLMVRIFKYASIFTIIFLLISGIGLRVRLVLKGIFIHSLGFKMKI